MIQLSYSDFRVGLPCQILQKKTIKTTFLKLIDEKPLNKITVGMIAEECGINRNSFYYHFNDIPSHIEEIIKATADALIQKYPSIKTLDEALEATFYFTLKNKKSVLNNCNSVNRSIYEQYLMKICEYVVTKYFESAFDEEKEPVNKSDKEVAVIFTKCTLFGLYIDWINGGMKDNAIEKVKRLIVLCRGLSAEMVKRCTEDV